MSAYDERAVPSFELSDSIFKEICRKVFRSAGDASHLEPLSNGVVNVVYKFSRNDELFVLRFYVRDPSLCEIERQILQLVSPRVSVPEWIGADQNFIPYPFALLTPPRSVLAV